MPCTPPITRPREVCNETASVNQGECHAAGAGPNAASLRAASRRRDSADPGASPRASRSQRDPRPSAREGGRHMSATLNTAPARRLPVPPRRRTVGSLVTTAAVLAVVVGLHVVAVRTTQFSLTELISGWHGIWVFLFGDQKTAGALPPDLSWKIIGPALYQCVVTFSMGLLGTTFS